MSRGLPDFKKTLQNPDGNASVSTRQPSVPKVNDSQSKDLKAGLQKVEIVALDKVTNPYVSRALLNPNTITETKSANWVRSNIPGQNDPLLQWINGSERIVSFTVKVTKDIAHNPTIKRVDELNEPLVLRNTTEDTAFIEISGSSIPAYEGNILSQLEGSDTAFVANADNDTHYWPISIQPHLDYYRSLVIPRTSNRTGLLKNPPLVQLKMGSILGDESSAALGKWLMLSYTFNITKFSPDLKPIEAEVSFTFIEYVDQSKRINVNAARKAIEGDSPKDAQITNATDINANDIIPNARGQSLSPSIDGGF